MPPPGISKAQANRLFRPLVVRPYDAIAKLHRGYEDVVAGLIGDSTANAPDEWFYRWLQKTGADFPKLRILQQLWNDPSNTPGPPVLGTGSYDAATIVQAGEAKPVISDSFTRVDGALGSTPTGQTYTGVSGWSVSGNKMVSTTNTALALLDTGATSYTLSLTYVVGTAGGRVYFKYIPGGVNEFFVDFFAGTPYTAFIYRRVNGAAAIIGSISLVNVPPAGGTISLTVSVTFTGFTLTVTGYNPFTYTFNTVDQDLFPGASVVAFSAAAVGNSIDDLVITPSPVTLYAYNASTPGQVASYSLPRIRAQLPASTDLLFINYGYNEPGTDVTPNYLPLARAMLDLNPRAQLIVMGQPPRVATDPSYRAGILKNLSISRLAAREGWGFVNVMQRYLENPTYAADWLLPDGLHPKPAGSDIWRDEVYEHTNAKPKLVPPVGRGFNDKVRRFPGDFVASEGAPVRSAFASLMDSWTFDPATQQGIIGSVPIPNGWTRFNMTLLYTTANQSGLSPANNVIRFDAGYSFLGDNLEASIPATTLTSTGAILTAGVTSALTVVATNAGVNNGLTNAQYAARLLSNITLQGRPLTVQIRRLAADVADTFASNVHVIGVIFERAA